MAQHPEQPLAHRVHFAAIGWADRQGQAGFQPGRPAALLGRDGRSLSDQSTRSVVARAKGLDLVSPRSACLVPPYHLFQNGQGQGKGGDLPAATVSAVYDSAAPKGADRSKP